MEPIRSDHPLRRMFTAQVESAFCTEVGMCDPGLTDYLADLLVNFTSIDRLSAIRDAQHQEKGLDQMARMLAILSQDNATEGAARDRMLYRHIGDYALFWAGVYPEQLKPPRRKRSDVFIDYVAQGKRCYAIVSSLVSDDERPPAELFRHLSEDFEVCLHGLGLVRRSWEDSSDVPGDLLY